MLGRTPTLAARWMIPSGFVRSSSERTAGASQMSHCTNSKRPVEQAVRRNSSDLRSLIASSYGSKLSSPTTVWPRRSRASQTCEPMKPAAPVTRTVPVEGGVMRVEQGQKNKQGAIVRQRPAGGERDQEEVLSLSACRKLK